jgi:hypothetical protein
MNKLLFLIAALVAASPAAAMTYVEKELCLADGHIAEVLMTMRFQGGTIDMALNGLQKQRLAAGPEEFARIEKILIDAYRGPDWSSPEKQKQAILEYKNQVILNCYDR